MRARWTGSCAARTAASSGSGVSPPTGLITANLTLDYAGTASIGDWLETGVDFQKQGSRLAFGNGFITVAGERIVRASAVFLVAGDLNAKPEA